MAHRKDRTGCAGPFIRNKLAFPAASSLSSFWSLKGFRLPIPKIYCYIGNRLTQYISSATAFRTVVREIGNEIWSVFDPNVFLYSSRRLRKSRSRSAFAKCFSLKLWMLILHLSYLVPWNTDKSSNGGVYMKLPDEE